MYAPHDLKQNRFFQKRYYVYNKAYINVLLCGDFDCRLNNEQAKFTVSK